ncbi:MAG: serine/threonine-protein phosphatase [Planctomycetes bacterium]|nr:serine/threonine-protein phosphatase [Planctomycetota bacterium]
MATPLPGSIAQGPPSPAIPPANGTGTGRAGAPPRVARPVTARHVAPPTAPVAPAPPSAGDREADDFFAGMPLDGMVTDAPAPGQTDEGAASSDEGQSLSWMDEVEDHRHQDRHQDTERVRARDVQKGLMQEAPALPGFTFATRFEACHDVSGDFYEFIKLSDGRIGFAQGDVSGHGLTAGLIMSMAKKTLAIYAGLGGNPTEVLSRTNDALVDDLGGKTFVSMCYAILDPEHRTITWARAGHSPTIRYNVKSGALEEIKPKGMVVGMKKGPMFRACLEEQVTRIESGDVFLVYTDGITECMNRQQAEYGLDQLFEVVRKHAATGADHLLERIMQSVRQFRGGTVASDDATLLALVAE